MKKSNQQSAASSQRPKRAKELLYLLARGESEIATGESYDLETVLADADSLLVEADKIC